MGNLGTREKYGMIALVVVVILFFIYLIGIRGLNQRFEEQQAQLNTLTQEIARLDALRENNENARSEITQLRQNIESEEARFIPEINTEVLEQYVLSVFEDNGCPYLVRITSSDVSAPAVVLPDGSKSEDTLVWKRIYVQYSTTDGFNIPQYNRSNSLSVDGIVSEDLYNAVRDQLINLEGEWQAEGRVGYEGFIAALKELETVDPDAIKLYSIGCEDQAGYMLVTAEIDFYSCTFTNRRSENSSSAPYAVWSGDTSIATDAGFIGMPYYVDDVNSAWYNCMVSDNAAASAQRPFATYYSNAIFRNLVESQGLAATLGIEAEGILTAGGGAGGGLVADIDEVQTLN